MDGRAATSVWRGLARGRGCVFADGESCSVELTSVHTRYSFRNGRSGGVGDVGDPSMTCDCTETTLVAYKGTQIGKMLTSRNDGKFNLRDCAVMTKDLLEVWYGDILGEVLDLNRKGAREGTF